VESSWLGAYGFNRLQSDLPTDMTSEQAKALALNGMAFRRLVKFQSELEKVIAIQCSNGNWNYDTYMFGMANALILAHALLTGEEAKFLNSPAQWLRDQDHSTKLVAHTEAMTKV